MLLSLVFSALVGGVIASPIHQRQSSIPYGVAIFACTQPNTLALTFDDGPYIFGDSLLDKLAAFNNGAGAKATFFMNGNNWVTLESQASYVQRAYQEGHQLASHTENHAHLSSLDAAGITKEMTDLEARFLTVIGKLPTYMRPPYLEYDANVLSVLSTLGYHVIDINIDTKDYDGDYTAAINNFNAGLAAGGSIVLMHEVYNATIEVLIPEILAAVANSGKSLVTVGECLNDPAENWYRPARSGSSTSTTASATSTTSSTDTASASATPTGGCTKTYTVVSGDYCYAIWTANGLTEAQFRALNPSLDTACSLSIGQVLCVAGTASSSSTTSSTLSTTTISTTSSASPTTTSASTTAASTTSSAGTTTTTSSSTGTTSASATPTGGCTKTYTVVSGDYCYAIWTANGLTEAQFRALNPSLDSACSLSVGQVVCVAGTASTSSTTTVATTTSAVITTTTRTTTTTSAASQPTGVVDPNGTCGGSGGYVCGIGNCCSEFGWCGSTSDYCGTGCQPNFGLCT